MALSQSITNTVESWSKAWGDRLGNWFGRFLGQGAIGVADVIGKKFSKPLKPLIDKLIATGQVPAELKPLLDEIINPSGEISAMLGTAASNAMVGGALGRVADAILLPLSYAINSGTKNVILNPAQLTLLWLRKKLTDKEYADYMHWLGYEDSEIARFKELSQARFDAGTVSQAWLRDKTGNAALWNDLADSGVSPDRIAVLQKLAEVLPPAPDIIRFAVKEAYTPAIAEKFGQYEDFPDKAMPDAEKIGLSKESMLKYWAAHWDLPAVTQGFEMMHRGAITNEELTLLLRALDVMPFWRDKLTKISYSPYTRVDARRMWDLGVLNDSELKRSYLDIGYDDAHANTMVLWTKIYQTFPDLIARYKNGYIDLAEVKRELIAFGLSEDRANFLIETKVKPVQSDRIVKERDLTKAEIIKGVKKGVIREVDAIELFQDMGYDLNEANLIIAINIPAEETSAAQALKQLTKSDIIKALQVEQLTPEQAISKLVGIRYIREDAQFLVTLALSTAKPITETKQKELTKADIVKGVKLGVITAEEGYLMLQDIGYTADAAGFILALVSPPSGGSPDSYSEFKRLTQAYRLATGLEAKSVPPELIAAERELQVADIAFREAKARSVKDEILAVLNKTLSDATYRYNRLLTEYKSKKK